LVNTLFKFVSLCLPICRSDPPSNLCFLGVCLCKNDKQGGLGFQRLNHRLPSSRHGDQNRAESEPLSPKNLALWFSLPQNHNLITPNRYTYTIVE
jgi:hypothetical protein